MKSLCPKCKGFLIAQALIGILTLAMTYYHSPTMNLTFKNYILIPFLLIETIGASYLVLTLNARMPKRR
jgi:hypothetical protein